MLALLLVGCSRHRVNADAEVHEACLRDFIAQQALDRRASVLLLHASTERIRPLSGVGVEAYYASLRERAPLLERDAFPDLVGKNAGIAQGLPAGIQTTVPIRLFPVEDERRIFEAPGAAGESVVPFEAAWDRLHRPFPGAWGLVRLSRIGCSEDGSHALVQVSHGGGPLTGMSVYCIVTGDDTGWRVLERIMSGIS